MVAYKNFYETIEEATMRLRGTIVQYRDDFYYVLALGDHMEDGKFRVYMDQLGHGRIGRDRLSGFPSPGDYSGNTLLKKYDSFIEKNPDSGFVRKFAHSRHFHKFRPFPLGNANVNGSVVFTERSPTRNMHQGLLNEAVMGTPVESVPSRYDPRAILRGMPYHLTQASLATVSVDTLGSSFLDMLKGLYPTYEDVVRNLRDPSVINKGAAFHRDYSLFRGPLDTLLLCYKHGGVGVLDSGNNLVLSSTHEFLKEELTELNIFNSITIKEVLTDA